jgi:hypothetical protein
MSGVVAANSVSGHDGAITLSGGHGGAQSGGELRFSSALRNGRDMRRERPFAGW